MSMRVAWVIVAVAVAVGLAGCDGSGGNHSSSTGGGNISDTEAPSAPNGLTVTATTSDSISLAWAASTDNVGVTGYNIFRNGTQISTSAVNSFIDTGLSSYTTYTYTVAAFDAAGNISEQSMPVSAITKVVEASAPRYIGASVAGWHWGLEYWSEAVDDDLLNSAREQGITAIHLMLPQFEQQLGIYKEEELVKLDHFLDSASDSGVHVMISFINIYGDLAIQTDNPYYNPTGIEGLMFDDTLKNAFKNRIAFLIQRKNSINGRIYKQDPTISAWIIGDEPISDPLNYPVQAPDVTVQEFSTWLEEMASFIKSLDHNHLVTIWIQGAQSTLKDGDWIESLAAPSLDFIYAEDADMCILNYFDQNAALDYTLRLFTRNKPVVISLSFTSGAWDQSSICTDYTFQAQLLESAITQYIEAGTAGVLIQGWGSDLYPYVPSFAQCYTYTDSNESITAALMNASSQLNP